MMMLGNTAISTVSLRMSNAHMPREILRTVEPAKLLACQSVENRWTRANPSRVTSLIILSVSGMSWPNEMSRITTAKRPSPTIAENAKSAAFHVTASVGAPLLIASTSAPAK